MKPTRGKTMHYILTIDIKKVVTEEIPATRGLREVSEVAHIVLKANELDKLIARAASHLDLIDE
jgi:hypothetical protein